MGRLVAVELSKLVISEVRDEQIIVLKEREGERSFPIVIGIHEAAAIDRGVRGIRPPRPMTHDLLGQVIHGLEARLASVVIRELKHQTFFATLVLQRNGSEIPIDSRPSDAIAVALALKAPLFVDEGVFQSVIAPEA